MNELLAALGVEVASGAIGGIVRALTTQLRSDQQEVVRQTLEAAVKDAAGAASGEQGPAPAFLDVITRFDVLAVIAALSLAASPDRPVDPELSKVLENVEWATSNVDQQRFFARVVPAARQAIVAAGRSGGPLASLTLNLRLDDIQQRLESSRGDSKDVPLPPLPPAIPALLRGLFVVGDANAEAVGRWLAGLDREAPHPVRQLLAGPPEWLTRASGRVWHLLGEVAQAYDDSIAAVDAYLEAARRGLPNADRIKARAAYLMFALDIDNTEVVAELEEVARTDAWIHIVRSAAIGDWEYVRDAAADPEEVDEDDRRLIRQLRVIALVHLGDWASARAQATALHQESPTAPGLAILAAKTLLGEIEAVGDVQRRREGLDAAHRLAIRARDARREWLGPSEEAVEVAAQAAVLLHDIEGALRLCLMPPDGDALSREANYPPVRAMAATLAGMSGRIVLAKELATGLRGADKLLALAAIAEVERRPDQAAEYARLVLRDSTDELKRGQALQVLAGVGKLSASDLHDVDPEHALVLQAIHLSESGEVDKAHALLRERGSDSTTARFAQLSALLLAQSGQYDLAAERLEDAASRFGDPSFEVTAAKYHARAGDWERAVAVALKAVAELNHGSPPWIDAQELLVEAYARAADWREVERASRSILGEDPTHENARWALALALFNRRRLDDAWAVLCATGGDLTATEPWQAHLLTELSSSFESTANVAQRLLELADRFNEDERVRAHVVMALMRLPDDAFESDQGLTKRAQTHAADFLERFPESPYLHAISTRDDDDLIRRLEAMLRPAAERWRKAHQSVDRGAPAGLLAAAAGRPYAAMWPHRAPGHLPLTAQDSREKDRDAVVGRSPQVALDASVLNTLALLPELWPHVRFVTKDLVTTQDAADDVLMARDAFATRSAGSMAWDLDSGSLTITDNDANVDSLLEARINEMARGLRWVRAVQWRTLTRMPEFDDGRFRPWIGVADYCAANGVTFYCDDIGLRRLARGYAVSTFDTTALIDYLVEEGRLTGTEADALYLRLASEFAVDLPPERRAFDRLLARDGLDSLPAAYILSRAESWQSDPVATLSSVRGLLAQVSSERPDLLPRWTGMSALGMIRARGSLQGGLALIVQQILHVESAETRARLFFTARSVSAELGAPDPIPHMISILRDVMAGVVPPDTEAVFILDLFKELPDEERQAVVSALLKSTRPSGAPAHGPNASQGVSTVTAQASQARTTLGRKMFGTERRPGA